MRIQLFVVLVFSVFVLVFSIYVLVFTILALVFPKDLQELLGI